MRVGIRSPRERSKEGNRKEKHFNAKDKILDSKRNGVRRDVLVRGDDICSDEDSKENALPIFFFGFFWVGLIWFWFGFDLG